VIDELIELTSMLVATDSVNPSLVPGGAGEERIATAVANWARAAGLETQVLAGTAGRPSVIARACGSGGGRTLLLCGHLDTVGVQGMVSPHTPRLDGDRLYGRGAYDMKAGLAAAMLACREAAALDLAGDVVLAAVADEEHASIGVQEVLDCIRADAAIVTEPTELGVAVAHKGFIWSQIESSGRAAHGSRPHLGVDAIVKMGPILTAIGDLDETLCQRSHPLLGRGSLHASLIEGGLEMSSYPASCTVGVERRTLPGETAPQVQAELRFMIDECKALDPHLVAEARILLVREPFEIGQDAEIVTMLRSAAAQILGAPPEIVGASYWADAALIAESGVPTVMLGPGGAGAHAVEEWVSLSDTEAVARSLLAVATRFCA
jgi:acetylornithine deacetylase